MKVKIGTNEAVSGNDEMVMIIFDNDKERKHLANLINDMEEKEGVRILSQQPEGTPNVKDTLKKEAEYQNGLNEKGSN